MKTIEGNIVDITRRRVYPGVVYIAGGIIQKIVHTATAAERYILPGFIDAHIHIESTLLTPENFGHVVAGHGTVAVVTDPHEIANVTGVAGIDFMRENARKSPIYTFFTLPSCVPATPFDHAGATIDAAMTERLLATGHYVALSEMMNVPGVLSGDEEVMRKIRAAQRMGLPIDGHAPMFVGDGMRRYVAAGISTEHESTTLEEAREKLQAGMEIMIREGSAAKNYEALAPLLRDDARHLMFCSDDIHPDDLMEQGHIDRLVRRAIAEGYELFNVLAAACVHPVSHYRLPVGLLREGDSADFIVVDDLKGFHVKETFIRGCCVYDEDVPEENCHEVIENYPNNFVHEPIDAAQLICPVKSRQTVIQIVPNELVTDTYHYEPAAPTANLESVPENDIQKIVYINRYENGKPQVAFIRGFGLRQGALASSIAHDSHNIIAVGASDEAIVSAVNALIGHRGGISAVSSGTEVLPLPVAGIMSPLPPRDVAQRYRHICQTALGMGTALAAPFMTLAFMSLLVIPKIKIGERGLFDGEAFRWMSDASEKI